MPATGIAETAYYKVFWWHANTPVFPFTAGSYVTHGPLTEADDIDAVVPGITQPLVQTEV